MQHSASLTAHTTPATCFHSYAYDLPRFAWSTLQLTSLKLLQSLPYSLILFFFFFFFDFFFFFQAEDGIRDRLVTGVQTCALPISRRSKENSWAEVILTRSKPDSSAYRFTRAVIWATDLLMPRFLPVWFAASINPGPLNQPDRKSVV